MAKTYKHIPFLVLFIILAGCITNFVPDVYEDRELIVVEGLVTDQPGVNTIKISKSLPLGKKANAKPVKKCTVSLTDDLGITTYLTETDDGVYETDPASFRGEVGRVYILNIKTNDASFKNYTYTSLPMEMKPVPGIDTLYYEKLLLAERTIFAQKQEGVQVYLETHDPTSECKFYRWDYTETWEFRLPFPVTNRVCWLSSNSSKIQIKNTSVLSEDRIEKFPLIFIDNNTDRLKARYSILVDQYSLNEDEFGYWEKMQNISQNVGGLYDVTPGAVPSNIFCVEDPNEEALGYFSVSAKSSRRLFIEEIFWGIINLYRDCVADTINGPASVPIPGLGTYVWILEDKSLEIPPFRVITEIKGCADCTVRGTNVKPDFW